METDTHDVNIVIPQGSLTSRRFYTLLQHRPAGSGKQQECPDLGLDRQRLLLSPGARPPRRTAGTWDKHTEGPNNRLGLRIVNRIQETAAKTIAGSFRSTAIAALDIETLIFPMKQILEKRLMESQLQIRISKATGLIEKTRNGKNRTRACPP